MPEEFVIEAVIQSVSDDSVSSNGLHTMTLGVQQLPYHLAEGDWDSQKEAWADKVLEDLFHFAPNLRDHIVQRFVITPQDLERDYYLTGGNIFHGAMFLSQLFSSRPVPQLASYRTPVEGYYLCGAGTHPGGGVMGAPGHNAAHAVLADQGVTVARTASPNRANKGFVEQVMSTEVGSRAGYALARRSVFRPFARLAAKSSKK